MRVMRLIWFVVVCVVSPALCSVPGQAWAKTKCKKYAKALKKCEAKTETYDLKRQNCEDRCTRTYGEKIRIANYRDEHNKVNRLEIKRDNCVTKCQTKFSVECYQYEDRLAQCQKEFPIQNCDKPCAEEGRCTAKPLKWKRKRKKRKGPRQLGRALGDDIDWIYAEENKRRGFQCVVKSDRDCKSSRICKINGS